jgi:DNA-binding transcriptional MocR family regulator
MQFYEYHDAVLGSDMTYKAKLVALAIAYHYNWKDASASFPSIETLEQRTSLSRATIHRAKQELISRGYLQQTRRYDSSNRYLPLIPPISQSETRVVSEGRTNNEYNNEVNNEIKASNEASDINIIELNQGVNYNSFETIWKVFENEDRGYSNWKHSSNRTDRPAWGS